MSVTAGVQGAVGGLVGLTSGTGLVTDSFASGNVSGGLFAGGLVGFNASTIKHSWANGDVDAADSNAYAGGLVGINNSGTITPSYAVGAVQCQFYCGGLVGIQQPAGQMPGISRSFATGNITSSGGAGGLIGVNNIGTISDSYAIGAASAPTAGGLIGYNVNAEDGTHSVSRSYSSGAVTGSIGTTGGLIGYDEFPSTIEHTYWDITTSGITNTGHGAGNVQNDPGIKGLSNAKLQSGLPGGFTSRVWTENPDVNGGLPYIFANSPPK